MTIENLWLVSEGGAAIVEQRLNLQLQLQTDPTAVAKIRAEYNERQRLQAALQERCQAGEAISQEEFLGAYGDMVTLQSEKLAIVTVEGPIETHESWWHKYAGVPSYSRIRDILDTLVHMGSVQDVLFVWRSPGGNAKGSFALAEHMAKLQSNGLSMTSYADTGMMSAAILLGVVPNTVYASADADVGSVGAMSTMFNRSKQMEKMGVEAKTFKYGKLKDIGSPYRDMTAEEEAFFQSRINKLGQQIVMHVQKHRAMTPDQFEAAAGEAKIVFGSEAAATGLVDGVKTLDEVVNGILARHNASQPQSVAPTGGSTMKIRLNAQGLAAVASGMSQEEAMANAAFVEAVPEGEGEGEGEGDATLTGKTAEEGEDGQKPVPAAPVAPAMSADLSALVNQLTDEKLNVQKLTGEREALAAQVTDLQAQVAKLMAISAKAVFNLEVACGSTTVSEESLIALGADALTARHVELTAMFKARMPMGQRSTTVTAQPGNEKAAVPPAALRAHMAAVGVS